MNVNTCGCCTGTHAVVPVAEANPPGLNALAYRAGTYATFLETMLARLGGIPALTTRDPADPSIALLDAWAIVADVLTFYQERIANEGYLPTARQRRSVLELANLIGYRLRPGVAASVRLAFTVADGFKASIPAGTGAQSVPGPGESPQYFETSTALEARDVWNALAPRLTRPQVITPATALVNGEVPQPKSEADVTPTAADVIDTVYVDGVATDVRAGNALLFVFGNGLGEQYLRLVESVDAQAAQARTEITLAPDPRYTDQTVLLLLFLTKAKYLFPGSDIAARVAHVLTVLHDNVVAVLASTAVDGPGITAGLMRAALPEIVLQRSLADARGFTRVSAFLHHLVRVIETLITRAPARGATVDLGDLPHLLELRSGLASSPLAGLDALVGRLSLAPSAQPANALRLDRSVAQSFARQSDLAPRLIGVLNPAAAGSLYQAWSAVATSGSRVRVLAARVKATFFASGWAGPATVTHTPQKDVTGATIGDAVGSAFDAPPTIATAWPSLVRDTKVALGTIALDAAYENVGPGSWIAIDRPLLDPNGGVTGKRRTTYHLVTDARASNMDTGTGLSAKVTQLSLDPPWLSDVTGTKANAGRERTIVLTAVAALRDTVVYAQTEPLDLAEEPLDTDVEGDSIDLGPVYDGLEAGRWIIVSGLRTDIPGAAGITASEPAMIAAVSQGTQSASGRAFPYAKPLLASVDYVTAADANGDRLVVGRLDPAVQDRPEPDLPRFLNERFRDQVELAPGFFASAYVPSAAERQGKFPSFEGLLVDPVTHVPFPSGTLLQPEAGAESTTVVPPGRPPVKRSVLVAMRISDEKLHTVLTLAKPLAYAYDRTAVTIYGNVVDATHGRTTGEVLGSGDASQALTSFTLHQFPLTYVSAPTPSGTASTLALRVNELLWHEVNDLGAAGPSDRVYIAREDDAHKTTATFGNGVHGVRPPTGTANVKAVYRYGLGKAGNVAGRQISQLGSQPLGVQEVINPLPATGGADPDRIDEARANAPLAVMALDRLVSVHDYADFARTYAGIGKAVAVRLSDGRRQIVHLTVAGGGDIPIDPGSDLYRNLLASLRRFGDPHQPVDVGVRRVKLIVMSAAVGLQPDYAWESVEPKVRAAVLALFDFDARALGQTAFLSEAVRAVQDVAGVAYVNVTTFDGISESSTASQLAALGATLGLHPYVQAERARVDLTAPPGSPGRIVPAELVFMTRDIADTLILSEAGR